MIQRGYSSSTNKKQPQKFIPRRDLFPDVELPPNKPPSNKPSQSKHTQTISSPYKQTPNIPSSAKKQDTSFELPPQAKATAKAKPQSHKSKSIDPVLLIILGLGWLVLWPILKKKQPLLTSLIQDTVSSTLENPKTLQLLHAVGPYLEDNEQNVMYTITGILELVGLAKDVMNHTYHNKQQSMILQVPMDPLAKKVEMMKVIRPFVPENANHYLDHAVKSFDTAEKLSRNIEIFQNNRALAHDRKISTIETVGDVLRVIKPVLPEDYQHQADKAVQMLKMAEAMETTSKINKELKKEKRAEENEVIYPDLDTEAVQSKGGGQAEKMLNTFKSMLSDEQKESVDVIMKMAQMLAQPENEEQ